MTKANTINPLLRPIYSGIKWVADSKLTKHAGNQVYNNNRKFVDGLGVASIIAKDGLGCYLYVTQSLNNKDIPDDKRKFVASLDLTNGALMIALQLLMFFTVSHKVCQTKMFDSLFGKMFDRPLKKTYQAITKYNDKFAHTDSIEFSQKFEKIRNNVKDAFGGLTSLAAATIVGKRMLVPFIATPLAGKVEKMMNEKDEKKKGLNITTTDTTSAEPTMKGQQTVVKQPVATKIDTGSTNLLDKYRKQ